MTNTQKYTVSLEFTFESEVFPEDPTDVYQLADLEKESVSADLATFFGESFNIRKIEVKPV